MDILKNFNQNGYFGSELYQLLAQKKMGDPSQEIIPSVYEKEMNMTTAERLQTLNGIEIDNLVSSSTKNLTKQVLQITPKIIVFQNYKPNEKIVTKFSVKNISNVPAYMNLVFKETSNFFIKSCGAEIPSRLAPGISACFALTFVPTKFEDYIHRVTFSTDVNQYVLPLIGMGPRPLCDFPDEIILPDTPLKVESTALVSIQNKSSLATGYTLSTKVPFSIDQKAMYIYVDQKIDLKVLFKSMHLGKVTGKLTIKCETGETFGIRLVGCTHTVSIELEKSVVRFLDTYNTMVRQQTFKITNNSSELITYMCMKNDTVYNDFGDKIKLATIFYDLKDSESAKYRKLVQYDVLSSKEHERVYTRIFFDEIQALVVDQSLTFQNLNFSIMPISGNLWPNKTTEITITFCPQEIGEFQAVAFLDIDGIFDRLPVMLQGTSLPPSIHFNLETLDMDKVYISTKYNYEIVAINRGHINGVIVYRPEPTLFGSTISCYPEMHCLRPGDKETFTISFTNANQGPYFEELNFVVRDTKVVRKIYLKGEVVYPSLMFNVACLEFGNVSVGVPKTMQLEVINDSVVNVPAHMMISSDGPEISSLTLEDCDASGNNSFELPRWPREFNIEPSTVTMAANSRTILKVTLTANLARTNQTFIELEMDNSDSPSITLPVTFCARVPEITPAPDIHLRACFLEYSYNYDITVTSNEYWGYFTIVQPEEDETLKVDVGIKRGMIRPNTTLSLPITIVTNVLGKQEYTIRMCLFGSSQPVDICRIYGNGVRPIVTCTPLSLQWGSVKVLNSFEKTLLLMNDSPVTVHFIASMVNRDGRWEISPMEGYIEPESEKTLVLTLYLVDAGPCANKAFIQLEKVKDILVPVFATGTGSSIVVGEEINKVDLGHHITKLPFTVNVQVKNHGTRLHALEWHSSYKTKKNEAIPDSFFNLEPESFKLAANENIDLQVSAVSSKAQTVNEKWYLIGTIEGINKKELLLECYFIADFLDPHIKCSDEQIQFRYDYGPYNEYYKITQLFVIKNICLLPLTIELCAKPPFAFIKKQGSYKMEEGDDAICHCINYNVADLNVESITNMLGPQSTKEFIDCLTLKPVDMHRPPLDFFQDIYKIKMAFQFTHSIEERLLYEEMMVVQIVFDTTKNQTLKSKTFYDLMRIRFKGFKNKDAVKLTGKINFPNLTVLTPKIDFQCILNGSIASKIIKIHNPTPLMVCYKLRWNKCNIFMIPTHPEIPKIEYETFKESSEELKTIGSSEAPVFSAMDESEAQAQNLNLENVESMTLRDEELDLLYIKTKTLKKIVPMLPKYNEPDIIWAWKLPKYPKQHGIVINDLFKLTPHRGMLGPDEMQYIQVIFRPVPNICVRAVLEFEVLGGPSEYVTITGESSDLMYQLNTQTLNFKIRSFHEKATESLIIKNLAHLPFDFKTYLNEPEFETELPAKIIDIIPAEKILEGEEIANVSVLVRPGVLGYFHRSFALEIGHLPIIPIDVFGWGVIPQIYLTLPRVGLNDLAPEVGYEAIGSLATDFLEEMKQIFNAGISEHLNSPQSDKCFEDSEFQEDWHICSILDRFPSTMDIELAMERQAVIKHLKDHPEILTMYATTAKPISIPGFRTFPYVIDFGVVMTDSTVTCNVDAINYSPLPVKIHFAKNTTLPEWLNVKLCSKLNPGDTDKIEVVISPSSTLFPELEQYLQSIFYLEIPYGVIIPIHLRALSAVPYLKSNINKLDFGSVRCGDKVICSIPIKNVGKPTCVWYVSLRLKSHGPNPMLVLNGSGKYEPGEGGWLSISFKPTMEMKYEGVLVFRFHMNPTKMNIPVVGYGICPRVHIIGPKLEFPPTLPWADTTDIYFGLTNPCSFPIEVIETYQDVKWKEEDDILQLLHRYYNKPDELLVPIIKPGDGLPDQIKHFYENFLASVKKALADEKSLVKSKSPSVTKKVKSPQKPSKSAAKEKPLKEEVYSIKSRTETEIISDEIKLMKKQDLDPLKACTDLMKESSKQELPDTTDQGIIIFMFGSPCEEEACQEIAYTLGRQLNIPTVNFDVCVIDALCTCNCIAKTIITNAINDVTEKIAEKNRTGMETEEMFDSNESEFDLMMKKVNVFVNVKITGTPRSKTADKKKVSSSSYTAVTAQNIFHSELFLELMTDYFNLEKFKEGFVVDSLNSIILNIPSDVITFILKCNTNTRNVHLVLGHSDFSIWAQVYEETQRLAELIEEQSHQPVLYNEEQIQQIIKDFEEMDNTEYENADPELKSLYIQYGLEERRQKYYLKHGISKSEASTPKKPKVDQGSALQVSSAETKKKNKKEDPKGKPTQEYLNMQNKYNEYFKTVYEHLKNIARNWIFEESDLGTPLYALNDQIVGAVQKKLKKKSEIQLHPVSEIGTADRGFPLTFLMAPCLRYKEALVKMFKSRPEAQQKLKHEEKFDILKSDIDRKEFTVLLPKSLPVVTPEPCLNWYYLDELPIKKCECNQITDLNLLDDSTQDNVLNILSKWHCTCGKKVTSSQTSTSEIPLATSERVITDEGDDEYFYPLPLNSVKPIPVHGGRLILQPGDLVRCKYSFSPKEEGIFSAKRFIEVSGWPDSRVDINVTGKCDLPRLDNRPKKMFSHFVRRTVEDHVYKTTYLDDQKYFEFGAIFIGYNRVYEEEYTIDLRNSSLLTVEVDIEFMQEADVFRADQDFIRLEPGCRGKLIIAAAPSFVGDHRCQLLFCIKDNPEIVKISINCSGVEPVVEILPLTKHIDFGKLLLYRREDDRFIIKNDSLLPIMWKVRNSEAFVEDFIISQTMGVIPRNDNHVVPITYIACNVGIINYRHLIIDIYDELGRGDPMIVDSMYLSTECYDVMVECAYENPNENFVNYGNVKVNSTVYRDMYLLNRGKYNIYYKFKKVKNFPEPALLKSFELWPESGVIPPNLKLVSIELGCTPTTSMNLNQVQAYTCSLLDGSKDQVVVAKFPIYVTIASFYNTFTLFPLGELNFHIIAVGSGVNREVVLNNTSKCPFNYEIVVPAQYKEEQLEAGVKANPKEKAATLKIPPIQCGNFLINNEDNLLAPGTSRIIQIQFLATAARKFEETIHFIVSDTCPAEAQGVPLRLVGTGALPILDFWNIENTFREHLILKNLTEYKVPEPSPHCVFLEDSVTLHFFSVTVNSSYTGILDLYNNGLVLCKLSMELHYQANTNSDIFSLDKYEMQIDPLLHKRLGIIFTPKTLQEYRAVLEVKLQLLHNQEQTFQLCIIGEGVIPRIRLLQPSVRQNKMAVLRFPVTCLGSVSYRVVRFKNITSTDCTVHMTINQPMNERQLFYLKATECESMFVNPAKGVKEFTKLCLMLKPEEIATIEVFFNPLDKGRISCDVKIKIVDNPYEFFTILCEAEAFMEDVMLIGLEMLSMDYELDLSGPDAGDASSMLSENDSRKKSKSAPLDKRNGKAKKKISISGSKSAFSDSAVLKYVLDFGGCELGVQQKRSVIMLNNSEKVYKFIWEDIENMIITPNVGYISPGEEKDIEITFFSIQPVSLKKETFACKLVTFGDDSLTIDLKGATWDNRQTITVFDHNEKIGVNERYETVLDEHPIPPQPLVGDIQIVIVYSVTTEYTKYKCTLTEDYEFEDTFIYQKRNFQFKIENTGAVPIKISWDFFVEEEYPARIDKIKTEVAQSLPALESSVVKPDASSGIIIDDESGTRIDDKSFVPDNTKKGDSKETLFSGSVGRESVDTCFELDLPFSIEPLTDCIKPREKRTFKLTFSPLEAFDFKVRLKSTIDNLDPYDQNVSCKISARSLIPYVHLDIEESDYLTSGRRKITGVKLPPHMTVLEFNVLGSGCYKKSFNVINPTMAGYEFMFEPVSSQKNPEKDFVPVHCNLLKGYVEGGTSTEVTFTFTPTAVGVYESQWKFLIVAYNVSLPLMVVGFVRESDVEFAPTILMIKNSLVGFTTTNHIMLKNNENVPLAFKFKGNSLCKDLGQTPLELEPESGILKPQSQMQIKVFYTPGQDGPLSFKIYCNVEHLSKDLILCVNALSHLVKPTVTYFIIGNKHILNHEVKTNIHLEQTASGYERTILFNIKNDGSAAFFFNWSYKASAVKKYLQLYMEPQSGFVKPGDEIESVLHFRLKQVPVIAFPLILRISDGPEYSVYLYAEIEQPLYHFTNKIIDFGMCIVNARDETHKKNLGFTNDDKCTLHLEMAALDESMSSLYIDYKMGPVESKQRKKIPIFFRPTQVKQYEFNVRFFINSLCEEIITIKGEGVALLVDLYEGCQKSFDLGPVQLGQKIVRQIEVMNHSKVPIDATFVFKDFLAHDFNEKIDKMDTPGTSICLEPNNPTIGGANNSGPSRVKLVKEYRDGIAKKQLEMDVKNALSSMKVVPSKCNIKPYMKVPLKIQFKPMGLISSLKIQLNIKVCDIERPLVLLSGSATGMSLSFSQNSLQFGRVRKHARKILKVMLQNDGDYRAKFCWQHLGSEEFSIVPMKGSVAARSNVTFTITFNPVNHNPYVKMRAICNIENYKSLELALYGECVDMGVPQNQTLYIECPVREVKKEYVVVANATDETWYVLSEMTGSSFVTLRDFVIEANSTFQIPVTFKPKTVGKHEGQVLFSPLGENALIVTLEGVALHPEPNEIIHISVPAKRLHTECLTVHNITERPESYIVTVELVKVVPEDFAGHYEIGYPDLVKVWGEISATCRWTFICFEPCEMEYKVMFINKQTREYQFYMIEVSVTPSPIIDTLRFECRARESVQKELVVSNPLAEDAEFFILCELLHCSESVTISRRSETRVMLTYSPLVVGEAEDYLTINNDLVGMQVYQVAVKCLPAKEKALEFTATFGLCIPIKLRVENKTDHDTVFVATSDHPSLTVDKKDHPLAAFEKAKFLLWFEPTQVGVQNIRVSFKSMDAGEYVFNIKGIANEPKPQGPYEVLAGGNTSIKFKNVFEDTRTFQIFCDHEEFYVKTSLEQIKSKKEIKVVVYLDDRAWAVMPTGTLTIKTYEPAEPKVQWTYFLHGI